ncbi:hypothetical protein OOG41_00340 [Bacillus sp. AS_5]|uniref:hypothetical protein n=1 Tax=unclassified Bacillus (in: firmicutes) TaxID=185979 RepID=UPI00224993EF|nr:hypothetical protein [Bacillus sp. AS_3]MCW4656296.1 hypothetical protein [Bacillus sp. AS_3]MCX2699558.1 hypothetical protein [Bacillus sp. AS_5]
MPFVQAYSKNENLFMIHTGNTMGMRGTANTNFAYNALITLNPDITFGGVPSSTDPNTFGGTTNDWTLDGSWAQLNPPLTDVPATAVVDFALLVWSGGLDTTVTTTVVDANPPRLVTPDGTSTQVTINSAWSTEGLNLPFISNVYNRAADVTKLLQGLPNRATGRYSVTGLPTRPPVGYGAAWTLLVVYRDSSYPFRNVSLFPGFLLSGGTAQTITGFFTPATGPVTARAFVMAMNGDPNFTGDNFQLNSTILIGPNNPSGNFFRGQVNDYNGNLNTIGSFADRNFSGTTTGPNARAEFDITNVNATGVLLPNTTAVQVNISGTGDTIYMSAVGLQIDLGEARLVAAKSVTVS